MLTNGQQPTGIQHGSEPSRATACAQVAARPRRRRLAAVAPSHAHLLRGDAGSRALQTLAPDRAPGGCALAWELHSPGPMRLQQRRGGLHGGGHIDRVQCDLGVGFK